MAQSAIKFGRRVLVALGIIFVVYVIAMAVYVDLLR
jgi:hypothetical protein